MDNCEQQKVLTRSYGLIRKIKMLDTQVSKEEILEKYFEEIKKDLIKYLSPEKAETMSINSSINEEENAFLAGESQHMEHNVILENKEIENKLKNLKKAIFQVTGENQDKKKGPTSH